MSNSPHSSRNNKMTRNVPSPSRKAPVTAPFAKKIRAKLGRSLHFGENINDEQHSSIQELPQTVSEQVRIDTTKVVLINSSGDISIRTPGTRKRQLLIKNIVCKNWTAVCNSIFEDADILPDVLKTLGCKISKEFKYFCGAADSCLKHTTYEELSSYANKFVVNEAKVFCPFWYHAVCGAARVNKAKRMESLSSFEARKDTATNAMALATATVAKHRNPLMSALAKRISIILMHSGVKSQDFTRLQRLGISTSHKDSIRIQKAFSDRHDSKVLVWKDRIESQQKSKLLLREVKEKQFKQLLSPRTDDDMDVDTKADFQNLKSYKYFTKEGQLELSRMFLKVCSDDNDHKHAIEKMETMLDEKSPPSYR
jgi:hypothetical protein